MCEHLALKPFQRKFLRAATRPEITIAALSEPRGNGKTTLAGYLGARIMDPTDPLFRPGTESIVVAASLAQARLTFRQTRKFLGIADVRGDADYRVADSLTLVSITHKATNTKLTAIGSNGATAMGLLDTPYVLADEPGAWQLAGGQLVWDALTTARGCSLATYSPMMRGSSAGLLGWGKRAGAIVTSC